MSDKIKKVLELDLALAVHDRVNMYAQRKELPFIGIETIHQNIVDANMTLDQLAEELEVVDGLTYEVEDAYEELTNVNA